MFESEIWTLKTFLIMFKNILVLNSNLFSKYDVPVVWKVPIDYDELIENAIRLIYNYSFRMRLHCFSKCDVMQKLNA